MEVFMPNSVLDQPATPPRLRLLASEGVLSREALERALHLTGVLPDAARWLRVVSVMLLLLAAAFTLSGVIFFFAYNWADMPRFAKFGLIELVMLALVALAFYRGLDHIVGKVSLLGAAVFVGALLAVLGQVYQSGADSYALFLTWALLIGGWVVIGRFLPLWLLWWGLLNLTLGLYWQQRLPYDETVLWQTLFVLNAVWLFLWEIARNRTMNWLQSRWFPQLIGLATFVMIMIPTLEVIWGNRDNSVMLSAPLLYGGFVLATIFFYSRRLHDLFMLTVCAFSLIVIFTSIVTESINSSGFGVYLLLSLLVMGQAAVAVNLLMRVRHSWQEVSS